MKVVATTRTTQGSSASRRLRRAGRVPGIIYGGTAAPVYLDMEHNPIILALKVEAFHSSILEIEVDGKVEQALLRDYQMHPYKPQVMHIDFQRVDAGQKLHAKVPLHFKGQEESPAVKLSKGLVSHIVTEIEVSCLPADLPEFIEVDLSGLTAGKSVHIKDLVLPAGVTPVMHGHDDLVIVSVSTPGGAGKDGDAA